jgi:hypothetical protein
MGTWGLVSLDKKLLSPFFPLIHYFVDALGRDWLKGCLIRRRAKPRSVCELRCGLRLAACELAMM